MLWRDLKEWDLVRDQDTKATPFGLPDRKWTHECQEVLRNGWGDGRFWNETAEF